MSRFNKAGTQPQPVNQPIVSTPSVSARTGNNAPGFVRDAKSELFLLAVSNFVGQDKHYESGNASDTRFRDLVRQVATEDSGWIKRFLPWLRSEANMRTASIVGAVEATVALVGAKIPGGRQLLDSVLQRADEPGEALGYWMSTYPGQQIPKPIKRGIADAAARLYNEYNTLKYDTSSHGIRFGDVLELTHADPMDPSQSVLFKHLIDRRHGRDGIPSSLRMIHDNVKLRELVAQGQTHHLLESVNLKSAGMTWEDALSLAGPKVNKGVLWEALIPNMGYMALLRNLRNFDEHGVGALAAEKVIAKLTDPDQVARSRQLPMRFLSAFRSVSNLRWHYPLEQALQASLNNSPEFAGRTLILIDTSGSMSDKMSDKSELQRWDAAAIFGLALSQRCEHADVYSFSNRVLQFPLAKGSSLLVMLEAFRRGYFQGGGTATAAAVQQTFRNHQRVIILTDEQANYHTYRDVTAGVIPNGIPVITANLAGYRVGHGESGTPTRITIGGLSDQAFKLLPILERRAAGQWPF
jgi:hypothetical protein